MATIPLFPSLVLYPCLLSQFLVSCSQSSVSTPLLLLDLEPGTLHLSLPWESQLAGAGFALGP